MKEKGSLNMVRFENIDNNNKVQKLSNQEKLVKPKTISNKAGGPAHGELEESNPVWSKTQSAGVQALNKRNYKAVEKAIF